MFADKMFEEVQVDVNNT